MKELFICASVLAIGSLATAASVSYDFDTDQSASFTQVEFGGPDSTVNFSYDYSTHAQIPPAIAVAMWKLNLSRYATISTEPLSTK